MDLLIYSIRWIELSSAQQHEIVEQMIQSFGKPWSDRSVIYHRFCRPSCRVDYYIPIGSTEWLGAAISWKETSFRYLDKFFIRNNRHRSGEGFHFLSKWIQYTYPKDTWIWRTDLQLATRFYHKHPTVQTHGEHGSYIYQGTGRKIWEYEDILPFLTLSTAFTAFIASNASTSPTSPTASTAFIASTASTASQQ